MDVSIYAARLIAKQIFVGNVQNWARPFFFTPKTVRVAGIRPSCLSVHSGQGAKLFLDLC